jgi:U6 snRNA-associated Sm-like protein LSm2
VTVELKNDLSIVGTLKSVDQFLNIKLDNIRVLDEDKHPHMVSSARPAENSLAPRALLLFSRRDANGALLLQIAVRNCFIRGSVVRYVQLPKAAVDTQLLEDATRRGESC